MAIAVKVVDGVVADTLDDRPELLVVATQGFHRRTLFGHIAHKAEDNGALGGLDGLEHDVDGEFGPIFAQPKQV